MKLRTSWRLTSLVVVGLLLAPVVVTAQTQEKTWKIDVLLNGRPLLSGHSHVAPEDRPLGVDEICVTELEIERLVGGAKYVARQGSTNLDAVMLGGEQGAVFRVQRLGRISTRVHQMGDEEYITLGDLARALGAKVLREKPGRINLVLKKPGRRSILTLNR